MSRYEHERCEDLIEEWKARALVAERERDSLRNEMLRLEGDKEAYAEMMREACIARDQADAESIALREKIHTWLQRARGTRPFGPVDGCDHSTTMCLECMNR